jgi:CopG family transcriptional regulator/antitoxin EndoAI
MTRSTSTLHRRLNITLPEKTVRLIDRVAKKGDRSSFIAEAVERYVAEIGRANLRKQLKEGAIRRAERDLHVASEWFGIEEETWHGSRS